MAKKVSHKACCMSVKTDIEDRFQGKLVTCNFPPRPYCLASQLRSNDAGCKLSNYRTNAASQIFTSLDPSGTILPLTCNNTTLLIYN